MFVPVMTTRSTSWMSPAAAGGGDGSASAWLPFASVFGRADCGDVGMASCARGESTAKIAAANASRTQRRRDMGEETLFTRDVQVYVT
jgi:hypothetical protein